MSKIEKGSGSPLTELFFSTFSKDFIQRLQDYREEKLALKQQADPENPAHLQIPQLMEKHGLKGSVKSKKK